MCGRFSLQAEESELLERYKGVAGDNFKWMSIPEVFPGQAIPAVIKGEKTRLGLLHWGFYLPGKSKSKPVINARVETLEEKRMLKKAFKSRRCLIPADGYFEWKKDENIKVKYRISSKDGGILSMAGLYDIFTGIDGSSWWGVVIVTAPSEGDVSQVHHRMPLIVGREWEEYWLTTRKNEEPYLLKDKVLSSFSTGQLQVVPWVD